MKPRVILPLMLLVRVLALGLLVTAPPMMTVAEARDGDSGSNSDSDSGSDSDSDSDGGSDDGGSDDSDSGSDDSGSDDDGSDDSDGGSDDSGSDDDSDDDGNGGGSGSNSGKGSSSRGSGSSDDRKEVTWRRLSQDDVRRAVSAGTFQSLSRVLKTVEARRPGTVVSVDLLESSRGSAVYDIVVVADGNQFFRVFVDARRNRVLEVRRR